MDYCQIELSMLRIAFFYAKLRHLDRVRDTVYEKSRLTIHAISRFAIQCVKPLSHGDGSRKIPDY
jgi:hypothetical protein